MLESQNIEVNPETSKNQILDSSASMSTSLKNLGNNAETLTIKPKVQLSKFESYIISAYKKLASFSENKRQDKNLDKRQEKALREEEEKNKVIACEAELRKALEEIESINSVSLNKNI